MGAAVSDTDSLPSPMAMVWYPRPSNAGRLLAVIAAAALVFSAIVFWLATRQDVGLGMFFGLLIGALALSLGGAVAVAALGYYTLRYALEPGGLVISWLDREERIPYGQIDGILGGGRLGPLHVRGLDLPGYRIGASRSRALGLIRIYATSGRPDEIILVLTDTTSYALTPSSIEEFRRQLIQSAEASDSTREPLPQALRPGMQAVPRDAVMLGSGVVSIVLVALMIAWIMARFASLPDLMPIHFDALAHPDFVAPKADVFRFPAVGGGILLINAVICGAIYANERGAARLLAVSTMVIELVTLVAVARVVS
ncbi:MAG TPA: PH domain-containing protein [Chloroflexota bacterium]|jgi:Bacterial PH domain|nr:PH domain-containing protein [Chloroflexota bacterium]